MSCALVVDDEADIRELLSMTLERMGVQSYEAATLQQAYELLPQYRFDLCLTDMRLPDGNGMELIRHISEKYSDLPVAMITAHGDMSSAIEALKAGAFDFVNKPVELKTLKNLITHAIHPATTQQHKQEQQQDDGTFIGQAPSIRKLRATVAKLARSQAPIFIHGESGTGKELIARMIHTQGPRNEAPFIAVNCGAIPAELIESELFGHVKGSFTGANSHKPGLFMAANGGTLFLDEIAELPLDMQVKLLRVIQEKRVRAVGAEKEQDIDVRILSASHHNLADKVAEGEFREDLYFRINVIELPIPSLREHMEDLPLLVAKISAKLCADMGVATVTLTESAMQLLQQHHFPGNVRELENILERAITLTDSTELDSDDLQLLQRKSCTRGGIVKDADTDHVSAEQVGLDAYLEKMERKALEQALQKSRFNKTAAAKMLGITFRSLRYRLQRLGIE